MNDEPPGDLPFWQMVVFSIGASLVAAGAGLVVCLRTGSVWADGAVMVAILGVSLVFIIPWWLRKVRAAGISIPRPPGAIPRALGYLVLIAATVALEYGIYALTGNRAAEVLPVVLLAVPGALLLNAMTYAAMEPPKPGEEKLLRINAVVTVVLPLLFAFDLGLMFVGHRPAETALGDFDIASYAVLIGVLPVNAYFIRKRLLQVRSLDGAVGT